MKSEERDRLRRQRHKRKLEITRLMAEENVPILAGSDTPNPFAFPGFGIHDELEMLVTAGLTRLGALQAATINPARYLQAADLLGSVEEGKLADLVLLDANPLVDIRNTRNITAVVVNGHLLRRQELDMLLTIVEQRFAAP
jgi:imidazolonepropionase-like amidohydrolase